MTDLFSLVSHFVLRLTTSLAVRAVLSGTILWIGGDAVRQHLRAGKRWRALGAAVVTLALAAATILPRPVPLERWWLLFLEFGAAVYFAVDGWARLRRELRVTRAFKYTLVGLLGCDLVLIVMLLCPRSFVPWLALLFVTAVLAIVGWGGVMVKKRPSALTDGLLTASIEFFAAAMWLVVGLVTIRLYATRGWLGR